MNAMNKQKQNKNYISYITDHGHIAICIEQKDQL